MKTNINDTKSTISNHVTNTKSVFPGKYSMSLSADRNIGLDLLRIFSCISIIALHESGFISNHYKYWSFVSTIVRPALWVFLMLSGFFILSKPIKSIPSFYFQKILKLLVPLVVYAFIYQTMWDIGTNRSISQVLGLISWRQIVSGTVPWADHFWFIYTLLGLYLAAPFLNDWFHKMTNKRFADLLILSLVFLTIPPLLQNAFGFKINVTVIFGTEFFSYFILGYAILRLELFKYKKFVYIGGVLSFILTYIFNYISIFVPNLYTSSLNMLFSSIFLFVLFYNSKLLVNAPKLVCRLIKYISDSTYSIFLIHIFVMRKLPDVFNLSDSNYRTQTIINVLAIFIISFLLAQVIDYLIVKPLLWLINKLKCTISDSFNRLISNRMKTI